RLRFIASLIIMAGLLPACTRKDSDEQPQPNIPGQVRMNVKVAEAQLEIKPVEVESDWHEAIAIYGRVIPNPAATVEMRAPFAGTLRVEGSTWPMPGQALAKGAPLGWLDARLSPQEQLDLENKFNEARLK